MKALRSTGQGILLSDLHVQSILPQLVPDPESRCGHAERMIMCH